MGLTADSSDSVEWSHRCSCGVPVRFHMEVMLECINVNVIMLGVEER